MAAVFLLSPARTNGKRATLLRESRSAIIGVRLQDESAPIGEVFAWLSALYFRGKLTYARRFGAALVIAPGIGLVPPETEISARDLGAMGAIDIGSTEFVRPLRRDAEMIAADTQVVLLGSIATGKYLDTLLEVFGARLLFPDTFVGRGDMSRGGMLLRAARTGEELAYRPVQGATLHGTRPPRLPTQKHLRPKRRSDGLIHPSHRFRRGDLS